MRQRQFGKLKNQETRGSVFIFIPDNEKRAPFRLKTQLVEI